MKIRFGEFGLDNSGELRSGGRKVKLQTQPSQILRILIEHQGEIVTREELRKKVWPTDTFVDFDHGINNAIKRLRKSLGDTGEEPRYIETLPRRGYRFLHAVVTTSSEVSIAVLPFLSLSADPENEIFADGMCEEIISSPAQLKNLHVTARTSSFAFKGAGSGKWEEPPDQRCGVIKLSESRNFCMDWVGGWDCAPSSKPPPARSY
jgi:DNA-binding winged helix-turn-helix (wHTH) protein